MTDRQIIELFLQRDERGIAELERQLALASLAASQAAQTNAIEQYINPVPIPAYTVANPNVPVGV